MPELTLTPPAELQGQDGSGGFKSHPGQSFSRSVLVWAQRSDGITWGFLSNNTYSFKTT